WRLWWGLWGRTLGATSSRNIEATSSWTKTFSTASTGRTLTTMLSTKARSTPSTDRAQLNTLDETPSAQRARLTARAARRARKHMLRSHMLDQGAEL
ncbi:hypothetical protein M885DRAFT_552130, partial [Pelagophyceae sp. CCMP2097]